MQAPLNRSAPGLPHKKHGLLSRCFKGGRSETFKGSFEQRIGNYSNLTVPTWLCAKVPSNRLDLGSCHVCTRLERILPAADGS